MTIRYVILKWPPHQTGLPRYTFATLSHAAELETPVERLQCYDSLDAAAEMTMRLNAKELTTQSEECQEYFVLRSSQ